ncbi:arylsulfatase A-like enzyme [Catalinimonas alkaloidigena]|uniref:sulfatase family protein n=1 Tax=Catalinimonas alkaloidigena TaxID=1075417 RepID=UPI002404C924|nr:sulfatase-like hydrolase/transferase [Catalinimonas alkaloidigena]MDF9799356.1 arylsulfatase A-like enzyme [Catalinimonas alkaloidigena]
MNKVIITGIVVLMWWWIPTQLSAQAEQPNILLIITDQQHADMMSSAGNRWLETPNIDRLAEKGMRFTKAYVTNPVCSPSRFSMFTGRYPSAIDMRHNASVLDQEMLKEIIPEAVGFTFKKAGYETFYGGKSHLPAGGKDASGYGFGHHISLDERDELAEETAAFLLNRKSATPFFAAVNLINPHDICYAAIRDFPPQNRPPAQVPSPLAEAMTIPDSIPEEVFFSRYCPPLPANFEPTHDEPEAIMQLKALHSFTIDARKNWSEKEWRMHRWAYHRLTERVDQQIGQVLDALKKSDVGENTIVIFTSDHGEMNGSHRLEHKTVFYEESSNVPLIVWYEGMRQGGEVDKEHLISNGLDLYPTLCELAGIEVPTELPGISFAPLLQGDAEAYPGRKYLYMENELGYMARDEHYKYALYDNGEEMLIDLQNDPGEMINMAGKSVYRLVQDTLKNHLLKHIDRKIK